MTSPWLWSRVTVQHFLLTGNIPAGSSTLQVSSSPTFTVRTPALHMEMQRIFSSTYMKYVPSCTGVSECCSESKTKLLPTDVRLPYEIKSHCMVEFSNSARGDNYIYFSFCLHKIISDLAATLTDLLRLVTPFFVMQNMVFIFLKNLNVHFLYKQQTGKD